MPYPEKIISVNPDYLSKKIVISCGPIPAKLDSVKYITNRFKGGLALKTAEFFVKEGFDVTIVKWEHSSLEVQKEFDKSHLHYVNVADVVEYYEWFEMNAINYDVFIMAAAVANLMPVDPYKGKFPSHLYHEGDEFPVTFTIAPRAIDVIKKRNPKAFLVGYKLFDAKNDDELVEIASHTLKDSKANVIFANTPADAKNKKLALTQDGSVIPLSFDEHLLFIARLIKQQFFTTQIIDINSSPVYKKHKSFIDAAFNAIRLFEKSIDNYGTMAIKITEDSFVTTSRGHRGDPVLVEKVDVEKRLVYASGKATLNAPALFAVIQDGFDFVFHRHEYSGCTPIFSKYLFPGTLQEYNYVKRFFIPKCYLMSTGTEPYHGYIKGIKIAGNNSWMTDVVKNITGITEKPLKVDWNQYADIFPKRYFRPVERIDRLIEFHKNKGEKTLEIGGNKYSNAEYVYDPYVNEYGKASPVSLDFIKSKKFAVIACKNAINYLDEDLINMAIASLDKNGVFIANTFDGAPPFKVTEDEIVFSDDSLVYHFLIHDGHVYFHTFWNRNAEWYENKGFIVEKYGRNSLIVST